MNVAAKPRSRTDIRKMANKLRELVGFEDTPKFPIVEFIEWVLANPDDGIDLEIVDPEEMEDTYSTTNTGINKMCIRSDVYEGAIAGDPRDRFTLCHEVGHYFLHQPSSISFARGNVPRYRDPEWQANTFAGELMAPYDLIKNMSIPEIMEKCGMSMKAAMIQYNECHR